MSAARPRLMILSAWQTETWQPWVKHNEPKGSCGLTKPLANPRVEVKVGCWNVRTIYSVGKTVQNTREMN